MNTSKNNINNYINNNIGNMNNTSKFISDTYDKLSYYDLYGNSVILFFFLTLSVLSVYIFCQVGIQKETIASDWTNQRCKPQNVLFAGFITKPEGKTAFQYTGENFQYCVQNILLNITSYALLPFQYATNSIVNLFNLLGSSIDKIRTILSSTRSNINVFSQDVLQRILNTLVPLQMVFLAVKDTFNKIQGVMVSGLYTMLGSYFTLQSLMGAILELVIKMLIVLVIVIVGLWIIPFTWPVAAAMSAVFLGISIPLAIIIYFMSDVLHIQTSGIPRLRCFDKETLIEMKNGREKKIKDILPGDELKDGTKVTGRMKVLAEGLNMYKLDNIVVSENHIVRWRGKWTKVCDHRDSIKQQDYSEKYVYCLNTNTKTIKINGTIFTDWDEIYGCNLDRILGYCNKFLLNKNEVNYLNNCSNIHRFIDDGYEGFLLVQTSKGLVPIKDIKVGDNLHENNVVYGIVLIDKTNIEKYKNNEIINLDEKKYLYHLLTTNGTFTINNKSVRDYNHYIDDLLVNLGKSKL
jgi:hypothetical protein